MELVTHRSYFLHFMTGISFVTAMANPAVGTATSVVPPATAVLPAVCAHFTKSVREQRASDIGYSETMQRAVIVFTAVSQQKSAVLEATTQIPRERVFAEMDRLIPYGEESTAIRANFSNPVDTRLKFLEKAYAIWTRRTSPLLRTKITFAIAPTDIPVKGAGGSAFVGLSMIVNLRKDATNDEMWSTTDDAKLHFAAGVQASGNAALQKAHLPVLLHDPKLGVDHYEEFIAIPRDNGLQLVYPMMIDPTRVTLREFEKLISGTLQLASPVGAPLQPSRLN